MAAALQSYAGAGMAATDLPATARALARVYFAISSDEVALVATPESLKISADLLNRYPDRILFGSDEVLPQAGDHISGYITSTSPCGKSNTRRQR